MIEPVIAASAVPIEPLVVPTAQGVTKFGDLKTTEGFWSLVTHGIDLILVFGGAVAFIALLYAGFMYITSGGDSAKVDQAKQTITYTIIGIIIIILSKVIVQFVLAQGK